MTQTLAQRILVIRVCYLRKPQYCVHFGTILHHNVLEVFYDTVESYVLLIPSPTGAQILSVSIRKTSFKEKSHSWEANCRYANLHQLLNYVPLQNLSSINAAIFKLKIIFENCVRKFQETLEA
jgi:hypothetical protein